MAEPAQDVAAGTWRAAASRSATATAELPEWQKHSTDDHGAGRVHRGARHGAGPADASRPTRRSPRHLGQAIAAVLLGKQSPGRRAERRPLDPSADQVLAVPQLMASMSVARLHRSIRRAPAAATRGAPPAADASRDGHRLGVRQPRGR